MMTAIKKVPAVRFKGFEKEWEEKQLAEIGGIIGGGTPSTLNKEYWDGAIDWYSPTEIGDKVYANGSRKKITPLGLEQSSATILPANRTVLFTSRAGIGDMAILKSPGATNQGFQSLVLNEDSDTYFIYSMGFLIKKFALKYSSGSTFLEISGKTLGKMPITIPNPTEQTQIGNYFKEFDDLIQLQEQKLEKVTNLKKAMLEKMFPKENADVPEIRFEGFTKKWQAKKLEEISDKIGDGLHGTPKYSEDGDVFFINGNNLINGEIIVNNETKCVTEIEKSKSDKLLNGETILLSINGTIGNLAFYNKKNIMLGKSVAYIILNGVNKRFIYAYLQSSVIIKFFNDNLTGSTIKNLGLKTIRNTKLLIPLNDLEQQKIGEYFQNLDHLINQSQQKIVQLKHLRQALLQKMFI